MKFCINCKWFRKEQPFNNPIECETVSGEFCCHPTALDPIDGTWENARTFRGTGTCGKTASLWEEK